MTTEVKFRLSATSRALIGTSEKFVNNHPAVSVTNTEERDNAIKITKEVKQFAKDLESARTALVKPLNDRVKAINEHFKGKIQILTNFEATIKKAILAFNAAEEQKQREALAAIEKLKAQESSVMNADLAIISAANLVPAPVAMQGAVARKLCVTEVTDKKAFVKWCLDNDRLDLIEVNSAGLQVLGQIDREQTNIPGIKVELKDSLSIR